MLFGVTKIYSLRSANNKQVAKTEHSKKSSLTIIH